MWNNPGYISLLLLLLFFALPALYWLRRRSEISIPPPPAPQRHPLTGNLLHFPAGVPLWEGLTSLAKKHGTDVLHLKLPEMEVAVLSTSEAISDLLDRRSAIYSDRPSTPMELMGAREHSVAFMPYGLRWRTHRRLFHDFINPSTVQKYDANQIEAVSNLLVNLHREPETFREHIELLTGSLALSIAYGIQADTPDNDLFRLYKGLSGGSGEEMVLGASLVDAFPFLRHLPSWCPGVQFHARANEIKKNLRIVITRPVERVIQCLKSGCNLDTSMVSVCLGKSEDLNKKGIDSEVIGNTGSAVYFGMSDTANSTLSSFFLAMARNTGIMRTAQRHLDNVLGGERLPDHSDIDNLPYIMAIVKETLRWAPPLPIGLGRRLMEDDEYRDMFIPGGATILENIWAVCYDDSVYPKPHTYNPGRFLDKDGSIDPSVKAPEASVFGSGRRVCPGRHLAIRMLCLTIARILTVFDILPPVDDKGSPRIPEVKYKNTIVRHAMPFECVVKPRSENAIGLIYDAITI